MVSLKIIFSVTEPGCGEHMRIKQTQIGLYICTGVTRDSLSDKTHKKETYNGSGLAVYLRKGPFVNIDPLFSFSHFSVVTNLLVKIL